MAHYPSACCAASDRSRFMPIITCPKCDSRYDPGVDKELASIDPRQMSLKVVCPVCAQWLRLPENEPIETPAAPRDILEAMMSQSKLIERGSRADSALPPKRPWWRFW